METMQLIYVLIAAGRDLRNPKTLCA